MFSSYFFIFLLLIKNVHVLNNGLALTPPMGWMSWGYYECKVDCEKFPDRCLNEALILSVADAFFNEGYQEAGYEYIIIDDCWSEKTRENGRLVPDRHRFPRGMAYIADYIHMKGLKFGMYTNIAHITCMGYPGSKDHFQEDAQTFAEWGVDYIKVDGCFVGEKDLNKAYIEFGRHLNETGRPMVYSCSWPYYIQYIVHKKPDFAPIAEHCNMWRNYHDVKSSWPAISYIIQHFQDEYEDLQRYHGPGHWNDPDMLIFGHGELSEGKSRAHLSVHAMMSAPLLLSCDMNKIKDYEKKLLLNLDLIAVAQDPMGIMARHYKLDNSLTLYVKPHYPKKGDIYPSYSFLLLNLDPNPHHPISFLPAEYGINSTDGYSVRDVYTGVYLQNITLRDSINVSVVEDSVMYTLFPL